MSSIIEGGYPYATGIPQTVPGWFPPQQKKPECFVSKCKTCQYNNKCANKEE